MFLFIYQNLLFILSLLAGFFLLFYSQEVTLLAREGLFLWAKTIVPTLLPYILLSSFWIKMDILPTLTHVFEKNFSRIPIFCKTFPLFLTGIACGFPTGAFFVESFYQQKRLTKQEARQLLPLCCQVSPMFIMGYVASDLHLTWNIMQNILLSFYGSSLLLYLCFLAYQKVHTAQAFSLQKIELATPSTFSIFEYALHAIFTIGIYILLFSIFSGLLKNILPQNIIRTIFLSNLEITTGISLLALHQTHSLLWYSFLLFLLSFGGICTMAQVYSLTDSAIFSLPTYLLIKIMQTILAISFFVCIFVLL